MGKQHSVATMPQGEVVERRKALVHNLGMVEKRLLAVLPRQVDKMRFFQVAVSLMGNPEVLQCEPVSILKAVFTFARLGLDLDSTLGQAYIIPFRDKQAGVTNATVIIGYRGFIELGIRAGLRGVWANVVHANDVFEWDSGSAHELTHKPWWTTDQAEPGEPIAAYCIAEMPSELRVVHAMPWKQIMEIKAKAQSKAWTTDLEAMALKTPVRHASKFWPQSPGLAMAVSLDEAAEVGAQVLPSDDALDGAGAPPPGGGWGYPSPGEVPAAPSAPEAPATEPPAQGEHKAAEEPPPEPGETAETTEDKPIDLDQIEPPPGAVTGEPSNFPCPYCNNPYKFESSLRKHLKTKHPTMPDPYETKAPPPEPGETDATEPAETEPEAEVGGCYTCHHERSLHNAVGGSCSVVNCTCMKFAADPFEAEPPTQEPTPEPADGAGGDLPDEDIPFGSAESSEGDATQPPQCECGGALSETAFGFHCPACGSVYDDEMEKQR